ncbi:cold shock domain-containing protein [Patescibacteria group bacterium]|nr:cold shock domain-containing protein [Patescibacteria group bacterium]
MKGTIKKLDERKFGFIAVEGENDIFFHSNDCSEGNFNDLKEGDTVTFETEASDKGPKAVKVTLVA